MDFTLNEETQIMRDSFRQWVERELQPLAEKENIDPDTGISLGTVDTKIGTIRVTNNMVGNGKASQCVAESGSGFTRSDLVRLK